MSSDPSAFFASIRESIRDAALSDDDPFEAFNRAQGQGTVRDPYPMFAAMRATSPVQHIEVPGAQTDAPVTPGGAPGMFGGEVWVAVAYDAVEEVLRDSERFCSAGYEESMGQVMGRTILQMDGGEHTRMRNAINRAFSRHALERWERDLVRPVINAYVDRFIERGQADLVRELTFPFPVRVIAGMMGLPIEDMDDFHRWAIELISVTLDWEKGMEASRKLGALFGRVLKDRREEDRGDLISVLARAEIDGKPLEDEQIFPFLRLLAPAGAETTYRSSSNLLFGLLSNPDQLDAVRRDRSLLPQAFDEGLRWEPPLLMIMRTATCDTEVCGVPVKKGGRIAINMGAANRDPEYWEDPDRFDIFRKPHQHMAFAFGSHLCLGQHLARMETNVLLETLLDRLPNLRLDPAAEDVHVTGMIFRSPLELPVVFDAGTPSAS